VLLHLLLQGLRAGAPPIPLLHVDTGWKFREMIAFRDRRYAPLRPAAIPLRVHTNPDGVRDAQGYRPVHPRRHGAHRRDEDPGAEAGAGCRRLRRRHRRRPPRRGEIARQGARLLVPQRAARWDPKNQRPELWNLYNTRIHKGESVRVFPMSNWTELDIWLYIYREKHPGAAAVLRGAAPGGRTRRHADHGRRRAPAAAARRERRIRACASARWAATR
jgi:sulfate adenylyltransferase subunit 2